jgi:hypothetical protein
MDKLLRRDLLTGDRAAPRPAAAAYYVDPGVAEPYSGGRNSNDVFFKYASRHFPRPTAAGGRVSGGYRYGAAAGSSNLGAAGPSQALSCAKCRGANCVFQAPHSPGDFFCKECNDRAIS